MADRTSRPRQADRILSQGASEGLVLLNVEDGTYYALNEVGSRVWELCDGTRTVADAIGVICDEFDAPRDQVEADVLELLDDLFAEKLVVEAD